MFELVTAASLTAVSVRGPDDPSHAKSAGLPANIRNAAENGDPAGSNNLSGPLKAVEDSGTAGQDPIWIVYLESVSGPPPPFSSFNTVAAAVNATNGQQVYPAIIAQDTPYSRLGRSGAWLYLGYGLDWPTVNLIALLLALEMGGIFSWTVGERNLRFKSVHLIPRDLQLWLVICPQASAFYFVGRFVTWGDPVATTVLEL